MALRKLYYALSPQQRLLARRLVFAPLDAWDFLIGRRDALIPPRGMIYTGSGDFRRQGEQFLAYFQKYGGLKPHHRVLDIGSGIGRMAVPLTGFLDEAGSYEGFDVVEMGVHWCKKKISSRFPNFRFQYIPLKNDLYTSEGKEAAGFHFPYPAEDFDFVFLTSVFTHMLPDQVENYLREIERVLRPGGRVFATFFIIKNGSIAPQHPDRPFNFPFDHGHYRLMDESVQSANVAFLEDYLIDLIEITGLRPYGFHYGSWRGGQKGTHLDFQDILILEK